MDIKIPDELKAQLPQNLRGKILSATPVVMAVLSTMLAGLASSEMTRAQYDRSLAAQQQSKAGDQWGFFQAKRLRGALQRGTLDLLANTSELHPLDAAALRRAVDQLPAQPGGSETTQLKADLIAMLASTEAQTALVLLQKGELPGIGAAPAVDPGIKAATAAIENLRPDSEIAILLSRVDNSSLDNALHATRERVQALDTVMNPTAQAIDRLEILLARQKRFFMGTPAADAGDSLYRDFTALRLRYAALRYDAEARLNQAVAVLYELQVRKSNLSAERHHLRSQRFFYGMLAAQLAVIIATFAMAARQRNLLWSIAAAAGLGAVSFAAYVYLMV